MWAAQELFEAVRIFEALFEGVGASPAVGEGDFAFEPSVLLLLIEELQEALCVGPVGCAMSK